MEIQEQLYVFLDIVITVILTALVGIEREEADKPAGVRTNMIVGGASCLLVAIMPYLIKLVEMVSYDDRVTPDPIRVLQAIVVGIGFIGAGTIMKPNGESHVKGLTTAATLLFSAGIGITVACKLYVLAVAITFLLLFINRVVDKLLIRFTTIKGKQTKKEN